MKFHHFWPPLVKFLASPEKSTNAPLEKILLPRMYTTVDESWAIGKAHCFE